MNERIRELEDQCWVKVPCDFDMNAGGLSTIRTVFDRKKFAELLSRECMEQIDDGNSDHAGGNIDAINRIKEHFGVE